MKYLITLIIPVLIGSNIPGQDPDLVKITYIANSGYLIEVDDQHILIDAVFDKCIGNYSCPEPDVLTAMMKKEPPFEKLDFVLVTHNHPDHVSDSLISVMMNSRNDFKLVCPTPVWEAIGTGAYSDNRVYSIDLDTGQTTSIPCGKMTLHMARSKHAITYDIINICMILDLDGYRIFHSGDCYPESLVDIIPEYFRNIDIAIVPLAFSKDRFVFHDTILNPDHTIISHVKNDFINQFKEVIKTDTATFNEKKDVLFEPMDQVEYIR